MRTISDLSNPERKQIIDDWIHSHRDRQILSSKFLDGYSHEKIAEMYDMSLRQINRIIAYGRDRLNEHIE